MKRQMYISQLKNGESAADFLEVLSASRSAMRERLRSEGASVCSVFSYDRALFVYTEAEDRFVRFRWDGPLTVRLERWPTGTGETADCYTMTDIFHYQKPDTYARWRESFLAERRIGHLARLKPEMVSSYIYYHYLRQEELPGSGNRTYAIGFLAPFIFSYQEFPAISEPLPPRMSTRLVPDDWNQAMFPHFEFWPDTAEEQRIWREMESVTII